MWIEFEADDGQLAFAKLAWVSPLRGTYLFTNRQGQKALSMTAEELAERFRNDRARLVEAEPLIDRAFTQHDQPDGGEAAGVRRTRWTARQQHAFARPRRAALSHNSPMGIGALIIGDEILSGKRQDKHLPHVIDTLAARGLALDFVHYLGDDRERLTALLRDSFARGDLCSASAASAPRPTTTRGRPRRRRSASRSCGIPRRCARSRRASAPTRIRIAC